VVAEVEDARHHDRQRDDDQRAGDLRRPAAQPEQQQRRLSRPTVRLMTLVSSSSVTRCQRFSKKLPSPLGTPNSLGSCPTRMVSARPMMNPFSTGAEIIDATNPSRSRPAVSATAPVTRPSAAVSTT